MEGFEAAAAGPLQRRNYQSLSSLPWGINALREILPFNISMQWHSDFECLGLF